MHFRVRSPGYCELLEPTQTLPLASRISLDNAPQPQQQQLRDDFSARA